MENGVSYSSCPILLLLLTNILPVWQTFSLHLQNSSTYYEFVHTRTRTRMRISQFICKKDVISFRPQITLTLRFHQSISGWNDNDRSRSIKNQKKKTPLTLVPPFTTRSALNTSSPHLCMNWIRSNRIINICLYINRWSRAQQCNEPL